MGIEGRRFLPGARPSRSCPPLIPARIISGLHSEGRRTMATEPTRLGVLTAQTETVAHVQQQANELKAQLEVLTWVVVKLSRSADQEVKDRIREGLADPASMFVTGGAVSPAIEKTAGDLLANINARPV